VNYHCIPEDSIPNFEKQLEFFRRHFCDVDEKTLDSFLCKGEWFADKPGLIISFDDGLVCQSAVAKTLEKYGFTGWFMVPSEFVLGEALDEKEFMTRRAITCNCDNNERKALSAEGVTRLVKEGNVICSHTASHQRMYSGLQAEIVKYEVGGSKKSLEQNLNLNISHFVWVGGEEETYSECAGKMIRKSGYDFSFTTNAGLITGKTDRFQLGRVNIESYNPLSLICFQLSGLIDLLYLGKRIRVNKLI